MSNSHLTWLLNCTPVFGCNIKWCRSFWSVCNKIVDHWTSHMFLNLLFLCLVVLFVFWWWLLFWVVEGGCVWGGCYCCYLCFCFCFLFKKKIKEVLHLFGSGLREKERKKERKTNQEKIIERKRKKEWERQTDRQTLTRGLLWTPPTHTQGGNGVGWGGERLLHFSTIFHDLMDDGHSCSAYVYHFTFL